MAAAQPFISGAISKTVNMPSECTVEEIRDTYVQAWKMGLKCVAIYRDGSKRSQPLNTKKTNEGGDKSSAADESAFASRIKELEAEVAKLRAESGKPLRRRLSDTRTAVTHKFDIAGHEGYLTVGLFDDGQPGELFITMAKEGSTIGGLMDTHRHADQHGAAIRRAAGSACCGNLRTSVSSRAASPKTPKSATPPRSLTTCSAGWRCNSSPATAKRVNAARTQPELCHARPAGGDEKKSEPAGA